MNNYIVKEHPIVIRMLSARHIREIYSRYVLGFLLFYFFYEWIPNILSLFFPANFFDIYRSYVDPELLKQAPYVPFVYIIYFLFLSGVMVLGRSYYLMNTLRNKSINYSYLAEGASHFFKATILMIIQLFMISLGLTLFFVPGVIIYYIYSQSFYVLTDNPRISILGAMRASRAMMKGNVLNILRLDMMYVPQLAIAYMPTLFIAYFEIADPATPNGIIISLLARIMLHIAMANLYMGRVTFYELMKYGGFRNFRYAGESGFKNDIDSINQAQKGE